MTDVTLNARITVAREQLAAALTSIGLPGETVLEPPATATKPILVHKGRKVLENLKGVSLHNLRVEGQLVIRACSDVFLEAVEVTGADGHGVVIDRCDSVSIIGLHTHDNGRIRDDGMRIGHGLLLEGRCSDITVVGLDSHSNVEDGIQQGNGFIGFATYLAAQVRDNGENAIDIKGGGARIVGSTLEQLTRDEVVLLHNSAAWCSIQHSVLTGHDKAPIATVNSGTLRLMGNEAWKPGDERWWRTNDGVFDKNADIKLMAPAIIIG